MKFDAIKDQIKTGDILAWSSGGWDSWYDIQLNLIRIGTRSDFEHVGLAYVKDGEVLVVEAVVPTIRVAKLPDELTNGFWVKFDHPEIKEDVLLSKIGQPYSKLEAVKAFLGDVTNGKNGVWECAELVNWVLGQYDADWEKVQATPEMTVKFALDERNGELISLQR